MKTENENWGALLLSPCVGQLEPWWLYKEEKKKIHLPDVPEPLSLEENLKFLDFQTSPKDHKLERRHF